MVVLAIEPAARSATVVVGFGLVVAGWLIVPLLLSRNDAMPSEARAGDVPNSTALGRSQQSVQRAAPDMTFALTSKDSVEKALAGIEAMNERTGATVAELNQIAEQVGQSVNQAIVSLQFQDMVTQLLDHVTERLRVMAELTGDGQAIAALGDVANPQTADRTLDALRDYADGLVRRLVEFNRNTNANPVRQAQYASGDVELF
ncbi:MAG: hypothetical protein ACM31P_12240 [Actinomycetota bacterium]